jgi:uncharacterized glyoxalase superfamily protein PhnB
MIKVAIPLLHVSNAAEAVEFYCGNLGFQFEFARRGTTRRRTPVT